MSFRVPHAHNVYVRVRYNRPLRGYCSPRCPCGLYRNGWMPGQSRTLPPVPESTCITSSDSTVTLARWKWTIT